MNWILVAWLGLTAFGGETKTLIIIGDSLTEGYGVPKEMAYPALLENKIKAAGKSWRVVNAGISGSTSASAPSRVAWALKQKPDLLLLALGANDGLRGLPVKDMEGHLRKALELCSAAKVKSVLAGMRMPPNFGAKYTREFEATFPKVAKATNAELLPFLLEKVAAQPQLNQADGIHPNEKGHEIMSETVYRALEKML